MFCGSGVMSRPQSLCVCARTIPQFSFPGTIGMNNRGAMGSTNVPAPAPPAAGPGAMIPDGAMGMTPPPPPDRFGQGGAMEGLGAMGGNPPAFNRGNPGGDFGPNKRRRY